MTSPLRLALFDVDGTLVDSQAHILHAMRAAFDSEGVTPPARGTILSIVGLSLPDAVARLIPEAPPAQVGRMVEVYKDSYAGLQRPGEALAAPLYPGARACLDCLAAMPQVFLGIATGKSRRGLTRLLDVHDLAGRFDTTQVADDHPSKPNPSMILQALRETGVDPVDTVMIGDTVFDMEMAAAAGVRRLAVSWGYHGSDALLASGAQGLAARFDDVPALLATLWGTQDE